MSTVFIETPRSGSDTTSDRNSHQSKTEITSISRTNFSSGVTSELNSAPRFCHCCPDECFQDFGINQGQSQMDLDLLEVGTVFDCYEKRPNVKITSSALELTCSISESQFVETSINILSKSTCKLQPGGGLPMEVWLREEGKDGPFSRFALEPAMAKGPSQP